MTIEQNFALQEISTQDCTEVRGGIASSESCFELPDRTSFICTEPKRPVKLDLDHTNNHCIPAFSAAWRS